MRHYKGVQILAGTVYKMYGGTCAMVVAYTTDRYCGQSYAKAILDFSLGKCNIGRVKCQPFLKLSNLWKQH